jgi:hypothetical protein
MYDFRFTEEQNRKAGRENTGTFSTDSALITTFLFLKNFTIDKSKTPRRLATGAISDNSHVF